MPTPTTPHHLKALPHGIDITAPGGIDALLEFHRNRFGDWQMNTNAGGDNTGGSGEQGPQGGQQQGGDQGQSRTFSQDDVNRFLAEEKRKHSEKYADYDDLKAKADKFDQAEAANQTELEKLQARAEKAEREREEEKQAREKSDLAALAATVAGEKGVPASHITGANEEELKASADKLLAWRGDKPAEPPKPGASHKPPAGTGGDSDTGGSVASGRERAMARINANNN